MKNKILIGATILMLAAKSALGTDDVRENPGMNYDKDGFYQSGELSVDMLGTASLGQYTLDNISGSRVRRNTRLGVGAGLNYFFTRNIGVGVDAYSENTTGAFVDSASANLILRFPLGQSRFAPYAFGGGGNQFDLAKVWFAQVGAGMEYRLTPKVGVFLDGRWVLPDETQNFGIARLGMRLAF